MTQRTPLAKAIATGRAAHDRKRFAGRNEPKVIPIGNPSPILDELQRKAWRSFKRECCWLSESDRALLELACILRAKVWLGNADYRTVSQLRTMLASMGLTPADRGRVHMPEDDEPDPADHYFH